MRLPKIIALTVFVATTEARQPEHNFATPPPSNLALTVVMVPVVAQVAMAWGMNPLLLVVPVTMASSCAFMLPMATPSP